MTLVFPPTKMSITRLSVATPAFVDVVTDTVVELEVEVEVVLEDVGVVDGVVDGLDVCVEVGLVV